MHAFAWFSRSKGAEVPSHKPNPSKSYEVFVSYSHHDAHLVAPVVKLLDLSRDVVFFDRDRIDPGMRWKDEISSALDSVSLMVVFWCSHSSQSREVEQEYRSALVPAKRIVPVRLDETPLPPELRDFQWLDFRHLARSTHVGFVERAAHYLTGPAAAVLPFAMAAAFALFIFLRHKSGTTTAEPDPAAILSYFLAGFGLSNFVGSLMTRRLAQLTAERQKLAVTILEEVRHRSQAEPDASLPPTLDNL